MSDAMDLLDSLDGVSTYTAQPETEGHIVVGEDRFITVPEGLRRIAVQNDHNIETVTFDCPRYWDNHDMSRMRVYVNYQRPDGVTGTYLCGEVWVDETDENIMHFNWTVGGHVTVEDGKLIIQVCVKRTENDTEINHWNSELNEDLYISKGLNCSMAVPTNQPVQRKMRTLEENGVTHITPDEGYLLEQVTVVVNVPTDTTPDPIQPSDVNFYDYDGTILKAYSLDEVATLEKMPDTPEHEGLVCQCWNYDLATVKARKRPLNVGALYITDDRKTRLHITIDEFSDRDVSVVLKWTAVADDPINIEWGDGTETSVTESITTHSYAKSGKYVIAITVPDGWNVELGNGSKNVVGETQATYRSARLTNVELGSGVSLSNDDVFYCCAALETISIPASINVIGADSFNTCERLKHINLPACHIKERAFYGTRSMKSVSIGDGDENVWGTYAFYMTGVHDFVIPEGITSLPERALSYCNSLVYIQCPSTIASIASDALTYDYAYAVDFRECAAVPTLANYCIDAAYIWVPSELHAEWIAANKWSVYASKTLPTWGEE